MQEKYRRVKIYRNNVTCLIGNHEMMMLDHLNRNRERGSYWTMSANGGIITKRAFNKLADEEKNRIIDCLNSLYLQIEMEIDGKRFLLSHLSFLENFGTVRWRDLDDKIVFKIEKTELIPLSPFYNQYVFGKNYDCAGAGLITRVSDYILLADALANDGVGASENRILTRESIDNMRRSRLDTPIKKADYRKARDFGYEYGLGVRTLVRPETSAGPSGEFGWDGYAGAFLLADVDNRISMFFAMSVGDMMPVKHIHHKIRDLMYEEMI